jgi:hypothetical protein
VLTNDIVNEIKRLYSVPELPDLYFLNIVALKRGVLLDLNFSIGNQGLAASSNDTQVILKTDNQEIEVVDVGRLDVGTIIRWSSENIRIPLNPGTLKLIIKNGEELSLGNNEASLSLN